MGDPLPPALKMAFLALYMNGYIKIFRKLLDWEWYTDANVFRLFIHLLLKANFKDKRWKGIQIKRGQLIIGVESFGKEIGLTRQQTKTALAKLQSTQEITINPTNKYTLVTIVKFDIYQCRESTDNQQNNHQITNEYTSNNHQITTTKEGKEYNKDNNIDTVVSDEPKPIESLAYYFETIEALNYLGDLVGTKFKIPTTRGNFERYDHYKSIKRRLKEGYSLDELKQVTKFIFEQWKDDKKMRKFIRPATIFNTKFKDHLDSMRIETNFSQKNSDSNQNPKEEYENFYKRYLKSHVIASKTNFLNKNYSIYKTSRESLLESEILTISKNETLTAPLLFDVAYGLCAPRAGTKPERRLKKFEVFLKGLSDYERNKGDLRKLFITYLDKM